MRKLRVLDLFSGIGGFSLGLERTGGFETVAFCEIEPYCQKVLAKHWPGVPIYDDIRELTADTLARDGIGVDVICGGFPCQDISSSGKKVGIGGNKSGLWREYARLVGELRSGFVIVENVADLLGRGMGDVLRDLAALGYDAEWQCISAADVGAPHGRDRVWIIAYPDNEGEPSLKEHDEARWMPAADAVVHTECRFPKVGLHLVRTRRIEEPISWDGIWPGEDSPLGMGMDDGVPARLDRLRALGNAVVPQIPELIGRAILASVQEAAE